MATIYCFTSTGNSLQAAKKIAEKINGKVEPMNWRSLTSDMDHAAQNSELITSNSDPMTSVLDSAVLNSNPMTSNGGHVTSVPDSAVSNSNPITSNGDLVTSVPDSAVLNSNPITSNGGLITSDDVIGFVFPVYFQGLPRMVERFIRELEITNKEAYIFAVATYGGMVHGILGLVNKLLEPKGVHLKYGVNLKSVENYIPGYKVNDSEAFRLRISDNIGTIADAVSKKQSNRIQRSTVLNKLIYRFYPDENSDRFFSVLDKCNGCAICQKICPAGNIEIANGKPRFLHQCEHCLACLHNCPVCAIDWKQKTQNRERYRNAEISIGDLISLNEE